MTRHVGKIAIVTGGASGIGASTAKLMALEGARLTLSDIDDVGGEETASSIRDAGGEAIYVRCDVSDEASWKHLLKATVDYFGGVDILINNAGVSGSSERDPDDVAGWHRIMNANALSVFLGTKLVVEEFRRKGGGSIVNTSSMVAMVGTKWDHPAYHSSKGAVRIYTKAAAIRYAPDRIRVNSVHPGFFPAMRTSNPPEGRAQTALQEIPMGRFGDPIEAARAISFLASDEASYITGAELLVDGGFTAQ